MRSLFPTRWLNATAREVGLVERRRKVAPAAVELAVVLAGAKVTMEQRRRWHALLSGEGADPNLGRLTLKRGWAC